MIFIQNKWKTADFLLSLYYSQRPSLMGQWIFISQLVFDLNPPGYPLIYRVWMTAGSSTFHTTNKWALIWSIEKLRSNSESWYSLQKFHPTFRLRGFSIVPSPNPSSQTRRRLVLPPMERGVTIHDQKFWICQDIFYNSFIRNKYTFWIGTRLCWILYCFIYNFSISLNI